MAQYQSNPTGGDQPGGPGGTVPQSAKTMSIIGIVLGVLAILFFPIVLGPIGAILGFVANAQGDKPRGMYVGIFCIVATIAGMAIGAFFFATAGA